MLKEAPGKLNFTMFLSIFGERIIGMNQTFGGLFYDKHTIHCQVVIIRTLSRKHFKHSTQMKPATSMRTSCVNSWNCLAKSWLMKSWILQCKRHMSTQKAVSTLTRTSNWSRARTRTNNSHIFWFSESFFFHFLCSQRHFISQKTNFFHPETHTNTRIQTVMCNRSTKQQFSTI